MTNIEQENNQVDPRLAQVQEIIGPTAIQIEPATRLNHLKIDLTTRICIALALEEQDGDEETFDQALRAKTVGDLMDLIPKSQ